MTTNQRSKIRLHGEALLSVFLHAKERDPIKLCKKLRRLEARAHALTTAACNSNRANWTQLLDKILADVNALLGNDDGAVPVFVNGDPRGYALKIRERWMNEHPSALSRDWDGYGLIAPEITDED